MSCDLSLRWVWSVRVERESVEREWREKDDTILVLDQVYTLVGVYIGSDVH